MADRLTPPGVDKDGGQPEDPRIAQLEMQLQQAMQELQQAKSGIAQAQIKAESAEKIKAAELALNRKTGARALRSIVEESLLEVMYDIPERTDVRKCIITEETIRDGRLPLLLTKAEIERGVDETNYEELLAQRGA